MKIGMTQGECTYCSMIIDGHEIDSHIIKCTKSPYQTVIEQSKSVKDKIFLIGIQSPELPLYWMFVEAKGSSTLEMFDNFLRKTWLECCGHMSHFIIGNIYYEKHPLDEDIGDNKSRTMKASIENILDTNSVFHHEYDYGTTTYLQLKVFAVRCGTVGKPIILVARNEAPSWLCTFCKNPATKVCGICGIGLRNVFCHKCLAKHSCTKEKGVALPLVNSPRTAQCGYTG